MSVCTTSSPKQVAPKSTQEQYTPSRSAGGINELAIPLDDGRAAVVPVGMTEETFDLLIGTLQLWKKKLVKVTNPKETSLSEADPLGGN